jgi:hypothetical protein
MIDKLVNDIIDQFIIEFKKPEMFDRIRITILDPITKYIRSKIHMYINLLLFVVLLYSLSQPIILVILIKQNRLLTTALSNISTTTI